MVQTCQKALNDISTRYAVGLYWVPGHAGVRGNEIADEIAGNGPVLKFGPEPALWVSRQDIQRIRQLTSIGYGGEVLVTPKDRLES